MKETREKERKKERERKRERERERIHEVARAWGRERANAKEFKIKYCIKRKKVVSAFQKN